MSKTPVSALHEFCQKKFNRSPMYELCLIENEGTHTPTFHYKVSIGDIIKIAKAGSKKEAKHTAAKKVLEHLQDQGVYIVNNNVVIEEEVSKMNDEYHLHNIGDLQNFCLQNKLPPPDFILRSDIGPAHHRHFTYECQIGQLQGCMGDGLTKKKAMHIAAQKMLERLQLSVIKPEEIFQEEQVPAEKLKECAKETFLEKTEVYKKLEVSHGSLEDDIFFIERALKEKNLTKEDLFAKYPSRNYDSLQKIFKELDLSVSLIYKARSKQLLGFLIIGKVFNFVEIGYSEDTILEKLVKDAFDSLDKVCL